MAHDGHQIGNHTWLHKQLTSLSTPQIADEVGRTTQAIQRVSGVTSHILRPPYGSTDQHVRDVSNLPQILWSIDPHDWRDRDASVIADRVIAGAVKGDIILLHDIYPSSVDAVPAIIDGLRAKGFSFATIDELLNAGKPPGLGEYRRQP